MGEDLDKVEEGTAEGGDPQNVSPLLKLMPPDAAVWAEARRLSSNKGIRVEDLATACVQDPIIVLELLKKANALFYSGGRSEITSPKTAIVRLGSDVVADVLEKIRQRPPIENEEVNHWFEVHRSRGRRTAIIATLIAQAAARTLMEDCQASALFSSIGEMLAVFHFQERYTNLTEDHSRTGVNYQLATQYRFDVERVGLKYLRKQSIPEALVFALDREAKTRTPERAITRPVCLGAVEMVEAFDNNRWEKLAPGKSLPPKSNLRLLQLDDTQYLKIYERAAEYLFSVRMMEQRKAQGLSATPEPIEVVREASPEQDELAKELEGLLKSKPVEATESVTPPVAAPVAAPKVAAKPAAPKEQEDQFSLKKTASIKKVARVAAPDKVNVPAPRLRTEEGTKVVTEIVTMFDYADNSEDLLTSLLERLIAQGPFHKTALIVVSKDRQQAIVVAARGPNIGNGQKLSLEDPLSPLAQCFTKVQSFGNRPNQSSPFGSKAFALAPIQADHDTPVALYADCGNEGSLTFEARRIFRTIVDILNEKLPTIPGGIPVELS